MSHHSTTTLRGASPASGRWTRVLAATSILWLAAGAACGQGAAPPAIDPSLITGRSFGGVRFNSATTSGRISFSASRAWTWIDEGTQRLVLEGDVRATLGATPFSAKRAAVWLEHVGEGSTQPRGGVWQVFVLFEGVSTPTGESSVRFSGDRLPVRGMIALPPDGAIELRADRREDGPPRDAAALAVAVAGERALAERLRAQVAPPLPRSSVSPDESIRRGEVVPGLDGSVPRAADLSGLAEAEAALGPALSPEPIFAREGVFTFSAKTVELQSGADQNALTLAGGVAIQYWDAKRDRTLALSAERAVVFLEPGPLSELGRAGAERVIGIYLEGDVQAGDGRFNLRSPRVYYDVRANRALLLDAVFWTFDDKRGLPLYVRAKTIAQESAEQFRAEGARLTNSAFFEPDLALGASTVTITRRDSGRGVDGAADPRLYVDARDITLRARDVPFFYWPVLKGEADQPPLKRIGVENSGGGAAVTSTWNLVSLLGGTAQRELTSDLLLDWYFERNLGIGTNTRWNTESTKGSLFAYALPNDTGRDVLPTGQRRERDGEFRGMLLFEHRAQLTERWSLTAEAASISDPTFVDALFRRMARERREFTNALTLRRIEDNSVLTARVQGSFDDFIANDDLLQAPGYRVARYPDVMYARYADDLLPGRPGVLTWSSEYRYSLMRMQFDQVRPIDRGYDFPSQSLSAFGTLPGETIGEALKRRGYPGEAVQRVDTRHELAAPLVLGPLFVTPWVVGRLTGYSEDFSAFAGPSASSGLSRGRMWGSAGITIAAEFQRVFNEASSRLFDINRLRHIVRPSVTAFTAASNRDQSTLPVFDSEVEALQTGTATRLALDQVLQTQRGGPGRWRSVDVATWESELVLPSGDTNRSTPIGRWVEARPEESVLGDAFVRSDATWQLSEVLGVGGGVNYDFGSNQFARSNVGFTLRQDPIASSYIEMRSIGSQDQTLLNGGLALRLSPTYTISSDVSYNTQIGKVQTINAEIRRQFPNVVLGLGISYDNVRNTTGFGIVLQPLGIGGGGSARGLGSADGLRTE